MESTVDISSISAKPGVHIQKLSSTLAKIEVLRLVDDDFAIVAEASTQRVWLKLTPDELRAFIDRLDALHRSASG